MRLGPPKAWVIRVPGIFVGPGGADERGSFETIVMAPTTDCAWEVVANGAPWTRLPFRVDKIQIFPKDPEVITGDHDSTR